MFRAKLETGKSWSPNSEQHTNNMERFNELRSHARPPTWMYIRVRCVEYAVSEQCATPRVNHRTTNESHTEGMMDLWHPFHDAGLEVRCRKIARTATSVDTYIEQRGLDWRTVLITLDQK